MEFKKFFVYPRVPENLQKLLILSHNLWFSWNYQALSLFYKIDTEAFRRFKYNAKKLLYHLPKLKLQRISQDKRFLKEIEEIWKSFEEYKNYKHPFIENMKITEEDVIAYFSPEFGFHPVLPFYSGRLGILAGDMIIGASDIGFPLIGISLLYKYGYFKQKIDWINKVQIEEPDEVEIFLNFLQEVKDKDGKPLIIEIKILDVPVKIKVWKLEVGKNVCYFLDTDIFENPPELRNILNYLYIEDPETRLKQEIILGIGGYYTLKALNIKPKIYHLNEGHSIFVIFARLKDLIEEGLSFEEAKMFIKETTIFTTHIPILSKNEHFPKELIKNYFSNFWKDVMDEKMQNRFFEEGLIKEDNKNFWLTALGIRNSSYINAVSRIHQKTAKKVWSSLFEDLTLEEIPIDFITNGVHFRWISEPFYNLLKRYLGEHFIYLFPDDYEWEEIFKISDEEIWDAHKRNKYRLVGYLKRIIENEYFKLEYIEKNKKFFKYPKTDQLIISCAGEISEYKRNTLILYNQEKLAEILKNGDIILIFAGKAHPKDEKGKKMIKEILEFREKYNLYDKVFFLENLDIHLARYLVWGSDVWLDTPLRFTETAGISGIKANLNGVLYLGVLDGWWQEGYTGDNGWVIHSKEDLSPYNFFEANQIYTLLEEKIQPLYYERDEEGMPRKWIKMMKKAIYIACKNFSINRVLFEYIQKFYKPALKNFEILSQDNYSLIKKLKEEKDLILKNWGNIKILNVYDNLSEKELYEGDKLEITVEVKLESLSPDLIDVQAVFINEMSCIIAPGIEEEIQRRLETFSIPFKEYKDDKAIFYGVFPLYEPGLKEYNVRIVPKNKLIKKTFPNLVKWKN